MTLTTRERTAELPRLSSDWVTTKQALWLCGSRENCSAAIFVGLPSEKFRSRLIGRRATIYRREHIERIAKVRREAGIGIKAAVRIVVAEIEGRL